MTVVSEVVRERLAERSQAAGLPPYAPVAMAEQLAADAVAGGASLDEALALGWHYLSVWLRHPTSLRPA